MFDFHRTPFKTFLDLRYRRLGQEFNCQYVEELSCRELMYLAQGVFLPHS
jgi:hypothetical protein